MTLLPEVRQELIATAARRATNGGRQRGVPGWLARIELGRVAVLAGVCCALAVAAIALISLRQQPSKSGGGAAASSLSALEAKLAILRRPQTPADRKMNRYLPGGTLANPSEHIAGLTRLAATVSTQAEGRVLVALYVERFPDLVLSHLRLVPRSRNEAPGVDAAVIANGRVANSTSPLSSAALDQPGNVASGLDLSGRGVTGLNPSLGISVGIVPDGVARVKWTFSGAGFGILHPHPVTVYAHVHNNLATASVIPGEGPLAQATWYSARGQLIASGRGGLGAVQQLQQIHAANASRNVPVAPLLLTHYSLFSAVSPEPLARVPLSVLLGGGGGGPLNYWQTRYVPSVSGLDGHGLWITPGRDGYFITDPQAGSGGKLRAQDAFAIIGVGTGTASEETLSGLVPDGNRTVTLVLQSGSHVTVPVVDRNVFEATVDGRIVAIINRDIQGRITQYRFVGDHP